MAEATLRTLLLLPLRHLRFPSATFEVSASDRAHLRLRPQAIIQVVAEEPEAEVAEEVEAVDVSYDHMFSLARDRPFLLLIIISYTY